MEKWYQIENTFISNIYFGYVGLFGLPLGITTPLFKFCQVSLTHLLPNFEMNWKFVLIELY